MENKAFDKKIAQHFAARKLEVNEYTWGKIADQLPKKSIFTWKQLPWAAVFLISTGIASFFILEKNDTRVTNTDSNKVVAKPSNPEEKLNAPPSTLVTSAVLENKAIIKSSSKQKATQNTLVERKKETFSNATAIAVFPKIVHVDENSENKQEIADLSHEKEQNFTQLVLDKLSTSNKTIQIDPSDLLALTENNIANKPKKTVREIFMQTVNNTYHELSLALKD